jgi:hypothetical protein
MQFIGIFVGIIIGIIQLYCGFVGLQYNFGVWIAVAAIIVAFAFRFTLPLVVGSFIAAYSVWHWQWYFALLLAIPGIIFMVPAFIGLIIESIRR